MKPIDYVIVFAVFFLGLCAVACAQPPNCNQPGLATSKATQPEVQRPAAPPAPTPANCPDGRCPLPLPRNRPPRVERSILQAPISPNPQTPSFYPPTVFESMPPQEANAVGVFPFQPEKAWLRPRCFLWNLRQRFRGRFRR